MERRRSQPKIGRRELIIGAAAFLAGGFTTYAGINTYEQLQANKETYPLRPEDGEAQKNVAIEWLPDTVKRWQPKIEKYSNEYHIDPNLMAIMMTVESGGDPNADSGLAKGLMQIAPNTAKDINDRLTPEAERKSSYELTDPDTNIEFAARYISHLIGEYGDAAQGPTWDETVTLVATAYNGGYVAANLYRDEKWSGLDKYDRQTFNYARYVRTMWQERHDPLSFSYRHWHDIANGKNLVENATKYQMPQ